MGSSDQILCFSKVFGQDKAKKLVSRTLVSGRMAHAYLFHGPDGVGKSLFARGVAAALNCRGSEKGKACGSCSSCRKFLAESHPDFQVVQPEKGTIKIAQIREMCRGLSYPPYESEFRVVVIEDVHTMRAEAANSLLKTLEEPPSDNVLILTAGTSQQLLSTISSRCQAVPFYALSEEDTSIIIAQQVPEISAEESLALARLSEGSPGKSLVLHEQQMMDVMKRVIAKLCAPDLDHARAVTSLLPLAEEMASLKEQLLPLLGLLRLWLRDMLMELNPKEPQEEKTPTGIFARNLKNWSSDALFAKLHAVNRAEKELKRNCNRTLVCEVLLFHMYE